MTDITQIKTQRAKLYLRVVLDLFDQRIVGWSMHQRQDRQMMIRAVQMAVWQRQQRHRLILHYDRGSQFRSGDYQDHLASNGLLYSMSAVGHCGDNAACEVFFGLLKRERTYRTSYPTLDAARSDVFEYIERRHNPRMRRRRDKQDPKSPALSKPSAISGQNPKYCLKTIAYLGLAERVGFEPTEGLTLRRFSSLPTPAFSQLLIASYSPIFLCKSKL